MIIVHITSNVMHGGVGTVVRTLIREQKEAGCEVAVVSMQSNAKGFAAWKKENNCEDVRMYAIEENRTVHMTVKGAISKDLYRRIRMDAGDQQIVFHYHNPISFGLLSYVGKEKKICTIHGLLMQQEGLAKKLIYRATFARMIRSGTQLVGCSEEVAAMCRQYFPKAKVATVCNGVKDTAPGVNAYVGSSEGLHVGFCGVINEPKGWRFLAQAYDLLEPEVRQKVHLFFAGGVSRADRDDFLRWLSQNPDVRYIGFISHVQENLFPWLDVLVLPSSTEGMPMVVLEAMQAGMTVIATPVGGIPEILEDGISGFLVPREAQSIAEKLTLLAEDAKLREKLRCGAKNRYLTHGSSKQMADQYQMLYQQE